MFLAAIMLVSVVGVSVAFTGSAAATAPEDVNQIPTTTYPGQEFNATVEHTVDNNYASGGDAYLVEITRDGQDIQEFTLVGTLNPEATAGGDNYYEVDTGNLETGTQYAISNKTAYTGADTNITQTFSVINENFGAEFDDSEVDETDNSSYIDLTSDRQPTDYNLTVSVSGPDDFDEDMIEDLFNATNGTGATVVEPDNLPMDHLGYDRDGGDTVDDLRDDGYVTLNMSHLSKYNNTLKPQTSELYRNFSNRHQCAGLQYAR